MSAVSIRPATVNDLDALLPLLRGYYQDDALPCDERVAAKTLSRLLAESQWGAVLLAEHGRNAIGYAVLCLGFSLELGGNDAFVDELYVLPTHRGKGIAQQLLTALETHARKLGVVALHLEVDRGNEAARKLYASRGYVARDRYYLMTRRLVE